MAINNNATLIRRDLLTKTIKLLLDEKTVDVDRIPIEMRPKNNDHIRCCVYKDRAVLKYKILAIMGFSSEQETDELKPISEYLDELLEDDLNTDEFLTVVDEACSSCKSGEYIVTNMCKGCVSRPCTLSCNKGAISIVKGQASIDEDKCVNCGLCLKVCPYHAIIYTPVPCEEACPVQAIKKTKGNKERIDKDNCIFCGKCIEACPFGAVVEKTHVYHAIRDINKGEKLVAMVAPAIMGQFKGKMQNTLDAIKKLGFHAAIEVAEGANMTTEHEANEWVYKMKEGQDFMTTSCCPSYKNLAERHIADLMPFVSETKSPMVYTTEKLKKEMPDAKLVFVGPCLGKKQEASKIKDIDYVINFEEIDAWMTATNVKVFLNDVDLERNEANNFSRKYAYSGGVTNAVMQLLPPDATMVPEHIQGIDRQTVKMLKKLPTTPQAFNFLEVMSCENGCVGGCSTLAKPTVAKRQIDMCTNNK